MTDFEVLQSGEILRVRLLGSWLYNAPKAKLNALKNAIAKAQSVSIDFSQNPQVDFAFCMLLKQLCDGKNANFENPNKRAKEIFEVIEKYDENETSESKSLSERVKVALLAPFLAFGKFAVDFCNTAFEFLNFFGMCAYYTLLSILRPKRLKIAGIFYNIATAGISAMPVVLITSFIVGYAIALQGVIQLDKMGVPIMSVEIVAKLSLRELGPFVLALVIAGRSASAFAAQIGVMNLNEENDALKTMGFSVIDYLVIPRILALVIMMPLLVFLADVVSLVAGMLAVSAQAGISFTQYWERFYELVDVRHFLVGFVKAPFFGLAIALVGCFRGLKIRGDSESIGKQTTLSVVNAIFWVIVINAIFSFITTALNV